MKKLSNKKILSIALFTALAIVFASGTAIVSAIPDEIILFESEKIDIGKLFTVESQTDFGGVVADGVFTNEEDNYFADVKFVGLIPVKTVKVSVVENPKVVPGGNSIGIRLYTDGLMVVGVSDFETAYGGMASPARNGGIKTGDIIKKVNSQSVNTASGFSNIVDRADGKAVEIEISRDGHPISLSITPTLDIKNSYKLGLWIRNSVAGIGTMTFYNPEKNVYGALGHGITDSDTNDVVPVGKGEVVPAQITSVKKSERGSPGELHGIFTDEGVIGDVIINSSGGIYGEVKNPDFFSDNEIEVAPRSEITEGRAYILSSINDTEVGTYEIEIQRVSHRKNAETKCMIIRVTDEKLLEQAGGILQGMSGSPIIQNGKLVGAVTHVFLNDPTRGYGIFADAMIKNSMKI